MLPAINEPLMEETENIEGDLWIVGNRTLLSLNLSRNKLTVSSVRKFLLTVQYQTTLNAFTSKMYHSNGLLKLNLNVKTERYKVFVIYQFEFKIMFMFLRKTISSPPTKTLSS